MFVCFFSFVFFGFPLTFNRTEWVNVVWKATGWRTQSKEESKIFFLDSPIVDLKNGQACVLGQLFLLVLRRVRMLQNQRKKQNKNWKQIRKRKKQVHKCVDSTNNSHRQLSYTASFECLQMSWEGREQPRQRLGVFSLYYYAKWWRACRMQKNFLVRRSNRKKERNDKKYTYL